MSEQNRAIIVRAEADPESNRYSQATFDVKFHFLSEDSGKRIDFKLFEIERDKDGKVTKKTFVPGTKVSGVLEKKSGVGRADSEKKELVPVAYLMTFKPDGARPDVATTLPRISFLFDSSANPYFVPLPDGKPRELQVRIKLTPDGSGGANSPDPAAADSPDVVASPYFNVSGHFIVPVGGMATYDWYSGNAVTFYSNASKDDKGTEGAFHDIGDAIAKAKHFVLICDWSFHPYMRLAHTEKPEIKDTIGGILVAKAKENKDILIAIHTWDHPVVGAAKDSDNDFAHMQLRDIARALAKPDEKVDWKPPNLLWRASTHTGVGYSHHQKMVVVDCEAEGQKGRRDIKVFFGGLDLTKGRFDWWAHPIMPPPESNPEAKAKEATAFDATSSGFVKAIPATGYGYRSLGGLSKQAFDGFSVLTEYEYDDWYNAEFGGNQEMPRQPWHDIHAQLTGPTAWDMVREFVGRWNVDPASPEARGDRNVDAVTRVVGKFAFILSERTEDDKNFLFVQQYEKRDPKDGQFIGQVLRSIKKEHWGPPSVGNWFPTKVQVVGASPKEFEWILNWGSESSIQEAYVRAIAGAQRFVYIESQYFIGAGVAYAKSVNNKIPKTIVKRVLQMIENKKPFHVYVVIPMYPEGNPDEGALRVVREYEASTMEYIATNVQNACEAQAKKDSSFKGTWKDYVSFYFPARWDRRGKVDISGKRQKRVSANQRYMIYVHSKLMIVDDEFVIVGSANLNERSLAGDRDTEICIGMTAQDQAARTQVQNFRLDLWSELLGNAKAKAQPKDAWKTPETAGCVGDIKVRATNNYVGLRTNSATDTSGFLCIFPIDWEKGKKGDWNPVFFSDPNHKDVDWLVMPDADNEGTRWIDKTTWRWDSPGAMRSSGAIIRLTDLPE